jgi:hypothetical protein
MKKTVLAIVLIFAFSFTASAHPPTDIVITFDLANYIVKADIMHDSKDITKHFIKQVEVLVNGKSVIKQQFSTQTGAEKQSVIYVIPGLKAGDKVAIDADCSIYGDLTKEAVVKDQAPAPKKAKSKAKAK